MSIATVASLQMTDAQIFEFSLEGPPQRRSRQMLFQCHYSPSRTQATQHLHLLSRGVSCRMPECDLRADAMVLYRHKLPRNMASTLVHYLYSSWQAPPELWYGVFPRQRQGPASPVPWATPSLSVLLLTPQQGLHHTGVADHATSPRDNTSAERGCVQRGSLPIFCCQTLSNAHTPFGWRPWPPSSSSARLGATKSLLHAIPAQ